MPDKIWKPKVKKVGMEKLEDIKTSAYLKLHFFSMICKISCTDTLAAMRFDG